MLNRIRYRVLLVVGIAASLGLMATAAFYTHYQEQAVLAQNERTMRKLTDSITQGLQSVMLAGSADIAQAFADRLKQVPEVLEFRIMRTDGTEAFRDNKTIAEVNERRGEELFSPRDKEEVVQVTDPADEHFQRALRLKEPVTLYKTDEAGNRSLSFVAPIINLDVCYRCHGRATPVRGMITLTTSLAPVERDILKVRQQSLGVLALALMGTMLLTGYMMGRTVVRPIERVTNAMSRVSNGDLDYQVSVPGGDELGRMAASFNHMTFELKATYKGLQREQDKLTTIIESATDGIVVTDASGKVVLVNPAASDLLGKTVDQIMQGGFAQLVDDPARISESVETNGATELLYNQRTLQIHASLIRAADGHAIGSAALLRDITKEKQLEAELRRMATTDALTSLYNRRFLDQTLDVEFNRAKRTKGVLSVIIFDIDHFKKFNDTYGHDQGDRVLQMVARCMRETVRSFDFPCRYGGEEYVAILPGMAAPAAFEMAEKLRVTIAATEIDGLHVHVSLGVASYPDIPLEKPEALIEAADAALYRAKEGGRNRVAVAEAEA